jgi:hypothetical protein
LRASGICRWVGRADQSLEPFEAVAQQLLDEARRLQG